jgi:flagellar hook-length control protein FliK
MAVVADAAPPVDAPPIADAVRILPNVVRHGSSSFGAGRGGDGAGATAVSGRFSQVAPIAGAASSGTASGQSNGSGASSQSDGTATTSGSSATASAAATAASSADAASALSGAAAVSGSPARLVAAGTVAAGRSPVDAADAANRLMNQVVQTIHSYQTTSGPAVEARVSDPNFGDVRMIVTGRAGEIVQAQLIVRDRVAADAITAAAARIHATSDALAGVSITVRSEGGGSATGGRAGSNAFEAATDWTTGGGYGAGGGASANGGHDGGSQSAATNGNGPGDSGAGDSSRSAPKPNPVVRTEAVRPNRSMPRDPLAGGASLDIRA